MTVAFNDIVTIRDLLSPEKVASFADTKKVLKQMSRFHWKRKNSTSVINILAQALYSLFAANGMPPSFLPAFSSQNHLHRTLKLTTLLPDPFLKVLQRGCFRYFQLGMYEGPIGLLAGLIQQPFVLFWHFYSVAFLSIWLLLCTSPLYMLPVTLIQSFAVFWTACVVIFPYIFAELRC
jgi:squalene monooxygenase